MFPWVRVTLHVNQEVSTCDVLLKTVIISHQRFILQTFPFGCTGFIQRGILCVSINTTETKDITIQDKAFPHLMTWTIFHKVTSYHTHKIANSFTASQDSNWQYLQCKCFCRSKAAYSSLRRECLEYYVKCLQPEFTHLCLLHQSLQDHCYQMILELHKQIA